MYAVKVIIQPNKPSDPSAKYSKVYHEGIFIPKNKECDAIKIKQQVQDYINGKLTEQNPGLVFDYKISTKKLQDDFLVCEDK